MILSLRLAPVFAQVPDATIQRFVEISIQESELGVLRNSGQISGQDYQLRENPIFAEKRTLQQQINAQPASGQAQTNQQIQGLLNARLATLQPQWQKQADAFQKAAQQHRATVAAAIPVDVRAALEPQRRRVQLQQQRDHGDITAEVFAAEDKKALDEIVALRNKYVAEGPAFVAQFDDQLTRQTQTLANASATTTPAPRTEIAQDAAVPAKTVQGKAVPDNVVKGDISGADYKRDVEKAADLQMQEAAVATRVQKKEIDSATYLKSIAVLGSDLKRLTDKWKAVGRESDFLRDYRARVLILAAERDRAASVRDSFGIFGTVGAVGIGTAVVGIGLIFLLFRFGRKGTSGKTVSTIYGTAAFYPVSEVPLGHSGSGIFLGESSTPPGKALVSPAGGPVFTKPEHHTLIVARTRTGKGTRVIVPTLLRYRGSALVIDPKGENAAITGRFRRDGLGQKVHVLNPWNELAGTFHGEFPAATFNPLDILDSGDPNAVAVAQAMAGAICPVSSDGKDHFWQGSAGNVLTGVFLWLADQPGEHKTLGRAREIVSLSRKDFTARYLVPMAASEAFGGAIRESAAPFIDMAQETYSGVMSNLSECTRFLSDPQIKAATASSSFSMNDLIQEETTVYVVIPTDRIDTQKTWLRLMLAASMYAFKRVPFADRPRHRCLFLIDEFAALGRLADFPRDIATMSGYGVDFALVIQGLDQLKDHYGEAKGTILSNCAYKWFCNIGDLDTAKWLSDTLGKKTVRTESTSHSSGVSGQRGSESDSVSHSETGRSLFNPDEILNLGKDVAIALHPVGKPHYLKTIDYWNLASAFGSIKGQHPDIFWAPPLGYDANPYNRESTGSSGELSGNGGPGKKQWLLSPDEARVLLGVGPDATVKEIQKAAVSAIKKLGRDPGSPSNLAEIVNGARDLLLGE